MLETHEAVLAAALVESLETMAFLSVMPPAEELAEPSEAVMVTIHFTGPRNGEVAFLTSVGFGLQLAENILGPAEDPASERQRAMDALAELANVLCGTYLHQSDEAATQLFDMSLPQVELVAREAWEAFAADQSVVPFEAEGHPLLLRLEE